MLLHWCYLCIECSRVFSNTMLNGQLEYMLFPPFWGEVSNFLYFPLELCLNLRHPNTSCHTETDVISNMLIWRLQLSSELTVFEMTWTLGDFMDINMAAWFLGSSPVWSPSWNMEKHVSWWKFSARIHVYRSIQHRSTCHGNPTTQPFKSYPYQKSRFQKGLSIDHLPLSWGLVVRSPISGGCDFPGDS